jgi:hypothetical protein
MIRFKSTVLIQASLTMACLTSGLFGATLIVNNVPYVPTCPGAYSTIQAAVNAANPGDVVYVCASPTPYNEQVEISKSITLYGQTGAELQPGPMSANTMGLLSATPIAAAIWVHDTSGVVVGDLIVDGSLNAIGGCSPNPVGIYYQNAAGTIAYNAVRYMELGAGNGGCQAGLGIFVESNAGTNAVTVAGNSVHDFQKNGITGHGTSASVTVSSNKVNGAGPTPNIAQNGIEIAFGATGSVAGNTVTNVAYSPCTSTTNCVASSTGILIYQSNSVNVTANNISTTQGAIYYFDANGGNATSNTISQTLVWDGIGIDTDGQSSGDNHVVNDNYISTSDESDVYIDTNNNSVTNNSLNETPIGIWFNSGTGNTQSGNKFYTTLTPTQSGAVDAVIAGSVKASARRKRRTPAP